MELQKLGKHCKVLAEFLCIQTHGLSSVGSPTSTLK